VDNLAPTAVGEFALSDWIAELERDIALADRPAPVDPMCITYAALRDLQASCVEARRHG
jgi:hypothetical protein